MSKNCMSGRWFEWELRLVLDPFGAVEKVLKQTPGKMMPKVTPSRPPENTTPQIPQGAGGEEARLCPHPAHFFLFTPFKLGNPESEEESDAHWADGGTKTRGAGVACPASQLGNGISGVEPGPLLFYRKEMRSPRGMSPRCQRGSANRKVGSCPSRSVNGDQVFQLSWALIHRSTGRVLYQPQIHRILVSAMVSCIQGHEEWPDAASLSLSAEMQGGKTPPRHTARQALTPRLFPRAAPLGSTVSTCP